MNRPQRASKLMALAKNSILAIRQAQMNPNNSDARLGYLLKAKTAFERLEYLATHHTDPDLSPAIAADLDRLADSARTDPSPAFAYDATDDGAGRGELAAAVADARSTLRGRPALALAAVWKKAKARNLPELQEVAVAELQRRNPSATREDIETVWGAEPAAPQPSQSQPPAAAASEPAEPKTREEARALAEREWNAESAHREAFIDKNTYVAFRTHELLGAIRGDGRRERER